MSGRSRAKTSRYRWERVWQARAWLGFTNAEIAEHLKVHHSTVAYYLRKGPPPGFDPTDGGQIADDSRPVVRKSSANSPRRKRQNNVVQFDRKSR